jgi:osmoprotectant transport system substrate-binding protein
MRFHRARVVGALVVGLALLAGACGDSGDDTKSADSGSSTTAAANKPSITVGAFNFPESAIVAHMYAGALEAKGYKVSVRENLGARDVVEPALEKGEIDLYPGYAATELEFVNKAAGEATPDADATVEKLKDRLKAKNITALDPSDAIDQNAFAVTQATADKYKLQKLSDLKAVANQLSLGGPPECPQRPFCGKGLETKYGITFKSFKALDPGGPLSVAALKNGDVDVALIFSSDGSIPANKFVVLDDDQHLQNADNLVPVIRTDKATDEVSSILNDVSAKLKTTDLSELNRRAAVEKEDAKVLADSWLKDNGFSK